MTPHAANGPGKAASGGTPPAKADQADPEEATQSAMPMERRIARSTFAMRAKVISVIDYKRGFGHTDLLQV